MKTLLILRHAHAVPTVDNGDHERPLSAAGRQAATRVGETLRERHTVPDVILASSAARALATAERVAAACGFAGAVRAVRQLYGGGPADCLELLRGLPDEVRCVLLVGHNPTLEQLAGLLDGGRRVSLPPAGLAPLGLPVQRWRELGERP